MINKLHEQLLHESMCRELEFGNDILKFDHENMQLYVIFWQQKEVKMALGG
jgi:hypothetical protein